MLDRTTLIGLQVLLFTMSTRIPAALAEDLKVQIKPEKDTIVVGEPLIVSSIFRNGTLSQVQLYFQNSPAYAGTGKSVTLLRVSSDGRTFTSWNDGLRDRIRKHPLTLPAGETATSELVIFFSREEGLAFSKPGQYWISAKVVVIAAPGEQLPYFDIEAKPVAITVREPDARDRSVWDWLHAHKEEYGRLIQIPWAAKVSNEFVDGCKELCATSESIYVQYLALFLSRWYLEGPVKDRAEAAKYAEIAKTKGSSEKVRNLAAMVLTATK